MSDVIDLLAGAVLPVRRPEARAQAQASFDALFHPVDAAAMPVAERAAVALFVARLHADAPAEAFYAAMLAPELRAAVPAATGTGPYGHYPPGPLTPEDQPGPEPRIDTPALGPRLAAALTHAHMLVLHPRDAAPRHMAALAAAGWSADGIVTLSQLVAFLSFQIRTAAGLRALASAA